MADEVGNKTGDLICETWVGSSSMGIWRGNNPTEFPISLFLLQISLVSCLFALFRVISKPISYGFVAHMLAGIVLGPSVLGHNKEIFLVLFSRKSMYVVESLEALCFMFVVYFTTAQVDLDTVKRGGRVAVISGFCLFVFPLIVAYTSVFIGVSLFEVSLTETTSRQLYELARTQGTIMFQTTYEVLSSLKMLNSEPGRLTLSTVMASNCFGWMFFIGLITLLASKRVHTSYSIFWPNATKILTLLAMASVCRPIFKWIERKTPEGQKLRPPDLCFIVVVLCIWSFLAEAIGVHYLLGSVILGLMTPKEPPLGTGLSAKLGSFVWAVLMPCFVIGMGNNVLFHSYSFKDFVILELFILVVQMSKFVAVFLPCLYYRVPLSHSVILGLVASIQGLFDVQIFKQALNYKAINREGFSTMVVSAMIHSSISILLLKNVLCSSTQKFTAYRIRTVQHCLAGNPLKILTCFRNHKTVPSILSVMELFCPSVMSPLSIFSLNMEELQTHSVPLLIKHRAYGNSLGLSSNRRDQVVNAFLSYEQQNPESVTVECFTSVAPLKTMHEDVCTMVLDKETDLVILTMDLEAEVPSRRLCRQLIENSICSVAILVDRGRLPDFRSSAPRNLRVKVCALFLGGEDDREMLAISKRMANHPNVELHVLRMLDQENIAPLNIMIQRKLDFKAINTFRQDTADKGNVFLKVVRVEDGSRLVDMLREEGEDSDLMMVGIRHHDGFPALEGLSAWSELRELGVLGDLLASPDLNLTASVMAVQQQNFSVEGDPRLKQMS